MTNKKALILGSSLFVASCSFAGQSSADLFETTDLGTSKEVKESILDINEVDDHTLNASPLELCCAYGNPRDLTKRTRKSKRAMRKHNRKQKHSK